jgi:hypothetical protein
MPRRLADPHTPEAERAFAKARQEVEQALTEAGYSESVVRAWTGELALRRWLHEWVGHDAVLQGLHPGSWGHALAVELLRQGEAPADIRERLTRLHETPGHA